MFTRGAELPVGLEMERTPMGVDDEMPMRAVEVSTYSWLVLTARSPVVASVMLRFWPELGCMVSALEPAVVIDPAPEKSNESVSRVAVLPTTTAVPAKRRLGLAVAVAPISKALSEEKIRGEARVVVALPVGEIVNWPELLTVNETELDESYERRSCSVVARRLRRAAGVVVPMPMFWDPSMRRASVPLVERAKRLAPGDQTPTSVSPKNEYEGVVTEPSWAK